MAKSDIYLKLADDLQQLDDKICSFARTAEKYTPVTKSYQLSQAYIFSSAEQKLREAFLRITESAKWIGVIYNLRHDERNDFADKLQYQFDQINIELQSFFMPPKNIIEKLKEGSIKAKLYVKNFCFSIRSTIELLKQAATDKINSKYRALNLAHRTVTIGFRTYSVTSEKVWDFIKDLCSAFRDDRIVPLIEGAVNNKNAVDQLRKLVGKNNLRQLILSVKSAGYRLNPEVKIIAGGQVGIRPTKQKFYPPK